MKKIKLFGTLEKAEKQDDGTLVVSGIASSEAVDGDGEIISASAIKAAIPDYMAFGAVREMHQPIAAGVALKCEVIDGKTHIEARIVDPNTIKKVESGVLKGFSVGGKITGRDTVNKSLITGISLTEISLVDRPCNPEALVNLAKVEDDEDEKDKAEEAEEKKEEGEKEENDDDEDDDTDHKGPAGKLQKMSKAHDAALSKILHLQDQLNKVQTELSNLKKQATPAKGVIRVSKGEDVTQAEGAPDLRKQAETLDAMTPEDRAMYITKMIHSRRK